MFKLIIITEKLAIELQRMMTNNCNATEEADEIDEEESVFNTLTSISGGEIGSSLLNFQKAHTYQHDQSVEPVKSIDDDDSVNVQADILSEWVIIMIRVWGAFCPSVCLSSLSVTMIVLMYKLIHCLSELLLW